MNFVYRLRLCRRPPGLNVHAGSMKNRGSEAFWLAEWRIGWLHASPPARACAPLAALAARILQTPGL